MLWEVEVLPKPGLPRPEQDKARTEFDLLTHSVRGREVVATGYHGYLIEGDLRAATDQTRITELLVDAVVEEARLGPLNAANPGDRIVTVLPRPGVMDPVALSVVDAARELGLPVESVRTFRRYELTDAATPADRELLFRRVLANDAIEQVVAGPLRDDHLAIGRPYVFQLVTVSVRGLSDEQLVDLSRSGQLALNLAEMRAIQAHFQALDRDPTDVELETIAQTWSEHCSHKTLKGPITFTDVDGSVRRFENLLKETVFAATVEVRRLLGPNDFCVSVFKDNAGVVTFDSQYHVCFKVETHNHPSAIEPYGGANTGLGGVIRDILGTGLGAKPVANTDVFCFAPPDTPPESLPPGVLHPRQVMHGVVAGVRDYGNRMGIPTVNGAILFDDRYLANPLVYCGTIGLLPVNCVEKQPRPGDRIVAIGGRTGRDGIHGATFSSLELTAESESVSGGAVQIGNPITEKKVLDVLLAARDRGLYTAVTDCGAGGFSSAVGEMAADCGAEVDLEKAPLKYEGLTYAEIWISESQERMVLAVPPEKWPELNTLCRSEGVETADLGAFTDTGRLVLRYQGTVVGNLDLHFLHDGRPIVERTATLDKRLPAAPVIVTASASNDLTGDLKCLLGSFSVCSKEWVVRQYDHEVQGGSVIKPLVGVREDGPGDAAVIAPVLGSTVGVAIGCGINPRYGDLDPYAMAALAIDEAVRNVVAVGADPARVAILDNFCWGNVTDPAGLGTLVRAAEACRDVAIAFRTPFISGKDSLNNEYRTADRRISIPGTLLISALGHVADVTRCVTMDLKEPGNDLYLVGVTRSELGGSHLHLVRGQSGGEVPRVDLALAPRLFAAVHAAIRQGLVRACHDPSEGGLAVAVAEMAFAGGIGADLTGVPGETDDIALFSESASRFLLEVRPKDAAALKAAFGDLPLTRIGQTVSEPRLRIAGRTGEWVVWATLDELRAAWQAPLRG